MTGTDLCVNSPSHIWTTLYNQAQRKSLNVHNIKKTTVLKTMIWHTTVYAWAFISISNVTLTTYTMGVEQKTTLQDFCPFYRNIGDTSGVILVYTRVEQMKKLYNDSGFS